jgi:hypothetical protein
MLKEVARHDCTSALESSESRITSVTKAAILAAIRLHPRFRKMFTDHLWYNNAPQKDLLDRLLKLAAATVIAVEHREQRVDCRIAVARAWMEVVRQKLTELPGWR